MSTVGTWKIAPSWSLTLIAATLIASSIWSERSPEAHPDGAESSNHLERSVGSSLNPQEKIAGAARLIRPLREYIAKQNVIHVTGSKGKTTTSYFLAQQLPNAGLFVSPHVLSLRERIQINGAPISGDELARRHCFQEGLAPFGKLFVGAMNTFAARNVQNLVVEAGIGGRDTVTRALNAFPARKRRLVMTRVELEHTESLGNTVGEIVRNKAALLERDTDRLVVSSKNWADPEMREALEEAMTQREIGFDKLAVGRPCESVFEEAQELARLAGEGLNFVEKPLEMLQIPPGRQQIRSGAHDTHTDFFFDGAHTINSLRETAAWYNAQTRGANKTRVLVYTQTGNRDYARLLEELHPQSFDVILVVPGASNFDLESAALADVKFRASDVSICTAAAEHLSRLCPGRVHLTRNFPELVREISMLRDAAVLVTGSLHGVGIVQRAMDLAASQ